MNDRPASDAFAKPDNTPATPIEKAKQLLDRRRAIDPALRDLPLGWWYHTKKKFPLFPGIAKANSAKFLKPYYRSVERQQGLSRRLVNVITYYGFYAWTSIRARQVARRYGLPADWAPRASSVAKRRFADPNDLALFRISDPDQMDVYVRRFEHSALSRRINPANWRRDCLLANKVDFYLYGMVNQIAVPALYAYWKDGQATLIDLPQSQDIIIKPSGGEGGDGVTAMTMPTGVNQNPAAFAQWLEQICKGYRGEWIVQERLYPSTELNGLSLSALPTMRVTTFFNERHEPEIVTSVLRFPSDPHSYVDNIKSGGWMAPIDAETGILGMGCKGRGVGDGDTHPHTGAQITGRQLESWDKVKKLVCSTHATAFREYSLVGWDIALTTRGPVVIEGNGKPCMIVAQRAARRGLGETRYGEIMAWHLAERSMGHDPLAISI